MTGFDKYQLLTLIIYILCIISSDDSVAPGLLQLLSAKYNWIEWGVLFRPDLEGTPRYATKAWVEELASLNKANGSKMK